ncbi:MAG: Crp/Fnr family transcriptional regulator, partial [Bacteroidota bacterium]
GEEVTRYFIDENNFAVDLNSFNLRVPSSEYIQAIVPTRLIVFKRSDLENLSNTIIDWDKIIGQITNKALMEKVNRISPMLAENAKTRYIEFYKRFPTLANRIPLSYLASYIGITKNSLSRIRKELAS